MTESGISPGLGAIDRASETFHLRASRNIGCRTGNSGETMSDQHTSANAFAIVAIGTVRGGRAELIDDDWGRSRARS
jgi:hypothetical protein